MPTVPTSFVPQVGQTTMQAPPAGGPDVAPMRNLAPEQEMQMGEATTRAGDTLQSIGMRIQYQLDDAATKNAETQFLENALKITRGQNGYLNTVGQQAV